MASNADEQAAELRDRLIALKQEQHRVAVDISGAIHEAREEGLTKVALAGVKLAVKRHFEEPEKREFREGAEAFAESLGQLQDTPLGRAAVRAVK